jgi:multiple sugar transport system permease protein
MKRFATLVLRHVILIGLAVIFLVPFAFMLSTSLKSQDAIMTPTMVWIPKELQWKNYTDAIDAFPFWLYTRNTLVICVLSVIGRVASSAMAAYGFSRVQWKWREPLFIVMLATIMLPAQATLLPIFLWFRTLGWNGTIAPLVVPAFFGHAFSIFLLRQFYRGIPAELSDAARLDGCTEWAIFWRIVAPLAKPALATVAMFAFMDAWTDFQGPLVYLHDENQFTLALGLQAFQGRHESQWHLMMAAATLMTIPMIAVFAIAQKTFVKGISVGGVKG